MAADSHHPDAVTRFARRQTRLIDNLLVHHPKSAGYAQSAGRLDALIQDMLDYSKVSKQDQTLSPVDLELLVQDILTQDPTFQDLKQNITLERPLETVLGNESSLTQVISNLLTNAVKFRAPDRALRIRIWTELRDLDVRLLVEDNGIGIDPENHVRIFNMFEQVDSALAQGTGIGLAIAKKAMQNMQGKIGLDSKLGFGSQIWLELPAAKRR